MQCLSLSWRSVPPTIFLHVTPSFAHVAIAREVISHFCVVRALVFALLVVIAVQQTQNPKRVRVQVCNMRRVLRMRQSPWMP